MISKLLKSVSEKYTPHPWQEKLAGGAEVSNRLIRIPTGMGKTLGVLATWILHRVIEGDKSWPTRLVWCLPMRTLVEQTRDTAISLLKTIANDAQFNVVAKDVCVHVLMGGIDEARWQDTPEQPSILIGTQDMLLSRALNRGYAMGRAAWPRAFGLLNSDALWVMDEVQLMGVGLSTSAQLQAFWNDDSSNRLMIQKPRVTWWMSATLQPDWLRTRETDPLLSDLQQSLLSVDKSDRTGPQWDATKPIERVSGDAKNWSSTVIEEHNTHTPDPSTGRQTLVIVNTVKQASELYMDVRRTVGRESSITVKLMHSRFRPADRESWLNEFLTKHTLKSDTNRILIATQIVEAGVDISASCLISELAPWPSLVQRFGRAARYGGVAQVTVLDREHSDEKKALPYLLNELNASRLAVDRIEGVSIREIDDFETSLAPDELAELYPYDPLHVLLRDEFDELFDSSPDLSGADMDISRFIREGEDRDVQVFWRDWEDDRPAVDLQPTRRELCSVPVGDAKSWLKKLRMRKQDAWMWDYLDGQWIACDENELRPGMMVLVSPAVGGYSAEIGFHGNKPKKNESVPIVEVIAARDGFEDGDASESNEQGSELAVWKTIATHCREAAKVAAQLTADLGIADRFASIIASSMRLHDWGKAHPAFASGTYCVEPERTDLAKAPRDAWRPRNRLYRTEEHGPRLGFRHELASCLATLELLRGANPHHPAILGEYHDVLVACGFEPEVDPVGGKDNSLANELNALSATDFNLLLYLIASHHGKVRVSMQASPKDQDFPFDDKRYIGEGMPIRGVREGDAMPSVLLPASNGDAETPELTLNLSPAAMGLSTRYGASWTERVQSLLAVFGPFTLGYLEAIIRSADGRASDDSKSPGKDPDPKLSGMGLRVGSHIGGQT